VAVEVAVDSTVLEIHMPAVAVDRADITLDNLWL
jgi:hypothetical protein